MKGIDAWATRCVGGFGFYMGAYRGWGAFAAPTVNNLVVGTQTANEPPAARLLTTAVLNNEQFLTFNSICRRDQNVAIELLLKNVSTTNYRAFAGIRANGTATDTQMVSNEDIIGAVAGAQYHGVQWTTTAGVCRVVGINAGAQVTQTITNTLMDAEVSRASRLRLIYGPGSTFHVKAEAAPLRSPGRLFSQTTSMSGPDLTDALDLVIGLKTLEAAAKDLHVYAGYIYL